MNIIRAVERHTRGYTYLDLSRNRLSRHRPARLRVGSKNSAQATQVISTKAGHPRDIILCHGKAEKSQHTREARNTKRRHIPKEIHKPRFLQTIVGTTSTTPTRLRRSPMKRLKNGIDKKTKSSFVPLAKHRGALQTGRHSDPSTIQALT